jgi:Fe-S cluster biogenesis protein NfuA
MEIRILTQQTPNPNAKKFIVNQIVKTEGKSTFENSQSADAVPLVRDIFDLAGVEQVHLFDNFITVTKAEGINEWLQLEPQIRAIIMTRMPIHDPNFADSSVVKAKSSREGLSPELLKIEEILDRTIRPGLQGDGGDLEVLKLDGNLLSIRYQGACGTCPSSISGTLQAIESILQSEFDPELQVRAE